MYGTHKCYKTCKSPYFCNNKNICHLCAIIKAKLLNKQHFLLLYPKPKYNITNQTGPNIYLGLLNHCIFFKVYVSSIHHSVCMPLRRLFCQFLRLACLVLFVIEICGFSLVTEKFHESLQSHKQ